MTYTMSNENAAVSGCYVMMTSWKGRAAHADTLGLGELALNPAPLSRNPSLLVVTLAPALGLRRRKGRRLSNGWAQVDD